MQWDIALELARRLAVDEVPFISREYAQQLEFIDDYQSALRHYESAVTRDPAQRDHDETCAAGVARMALRTGDLHRSAHTAVSLHTYVTLLCFMNVGFRAFSHSISLDFYSGLSTKNCCYVHWRRLS